MAKKQLKSLLIILVLMAVVAVGLKVMRSGDAQKSKSVHDRDELFTEFPINDLAELRIEEAGGAAVTLKKDGEKWAVVERGNYAAKSDDVVKFLRMVWGLKVTQNVQVGESQYGRLHLQAASEGEKKVSGQVEKTVYFKGKDGKALRTLYLGKIYERMESSTSPFGGGPSMSKVGRYVKIEGEDGVFLVAETFDGANIDPAKWLDEKFFKIENIKSVEIKTDDKKQDWKLSRDKVDAEFVLADVKKDEKFDAVRASAMKNAFSSPRFEDVVVSEKAAKKPNKITFLIDTFAGFHYVVKVGKKSDLGEYFLTVDVSAKLDEKRAAVKGESEEDKKKQDEEFEKAIKVQREKLAFEKSLAGKVFKVRSYVVDSINKKRADLMKKDDVKPGAGAPGGLPGGAGGGLPPGFKMPAGMQLPPGFKMPAGMQMPGGHPPVKKALAKPPVKEKKPAAKVKKVEKVEEKKPTVKKVEVKKAPSQPVTKVEKVEKKSTEKATEEKSKGAKDGVKDESKAGGEEVKKETIK
ncbi:MAG: DUF4340 domain-containing protein [Verrucomicrobiales bacterium]|nr:DUF4340 domain-containing protein [Verrucomicrobiales bacterium]